MSRPLVSIVIPAFQARAWVTEAVESALAQTHRSIEVVVVDDGSTDGTTELLRDRFGAEIRVIQQENRGLAAARNSGVAAARGAYVQFLDADDLLHPDKVQVQVDALEARPAYQVAYGDYLLFDDDDPQHMRPPDVVGPRASGDLLTALLCGNFIACHAAITRRETLVAIGGFRPRYRACEDWDLWLRLAASGVRFLYVPGARAFYRRNHGSMSSSWTAQMHASIRVLRDVGAYASLTAAQRAEWIATLQSWRNLLAGEFWMRGLGSLRRRQLRVGIADLARAVAVDPAGLPARGLRYLAHMRRVKPAESDANRTEAGP